MGKLVGRTVADRFDVVSLAGSGGMGAVYRAVDRRDGATVALKVLRPGFGDTSRFAREVATLAKLQHPSVVRYVDHGFTDAEEPYLVMEWLEGEDLAARLERGGALAIDDAITLARALAGTLADVHDLGIVHRDIKPANLFLAGRAPSGLKLLDFGVARIHAATFPRGARRGSRRSATRIRSASRTTRRRAACSKLRPRRSCAPPSRRSTAATSPGASRPASAVARAR
ncbi:MAG TPA: serine/threonine-protein kinase, partial [Minicystis sp.]|nr:serine/threonine-protein kinase [Minicystis sp.]